MTGPLQAREWSEVSREGQGQGTSSCGPCKHLRWPSEVSRQVSNRQTDRHPLNCPGRDVGAIIRHCPVLSLRRHRNLERGLPTGRDRGRREIVEYGFFYIF